MSRKVIISREINEKLDNFSQFEEEVNGVLLYKVRYPEICEVGSLFMTGVGTVGHVTSHPERVDIVNEFFRINPEYGYIKFHTHSIGTIQQFGDYYARHFSQKDIELMQKQIQSDDRFIAMLVTLEKKLLCGIDNPYLIIEDNTPLSIHKERSIDTSIRCIAKQLGYSLDSLIAHRRRT